MAIKIASFKHGDFPRQGVASSQHSQRAHFHHLSSTQGIKKKMPGTANLIWHFRHGIHSYAMKRLVSQHPLDMNLGWLPIHLSESSPGIAPSKLCLVTRGSLPWFRFVLAWRNYKVQYKVPYRKYDFPLLGPIVPWNIILYPFFSTFYLISK